VSSNLNMYDSVFREYKPDRSDSLMKTIYKIL